MKRRARPTASEDIRERNAALKRSLDKARHELIKALTDALTRLNANPAEAFERCARNRNRIVGWRGRDIVRLSQAAEMSWAEVLEKGVILMPQVVQCLYDMVSGAERPDAAFREWIQARNRLIEANQGLIHHIVRNGAWSFSCREEIEDAVSVATVSFITAVEYYDNTRGTLGTFMDKRIRRDVGAYMRRESKRGMVLLDEDRGEAHDEGEAVDPEQLVMLLDIIESELEQSHIDTDVNTDKGS